MLAARRADDLDDEKAALLAAGATAVSTVEFDADDTDSHPAIVAELVARGPVETAIVAFGIPGTPRKQRPTSPTRCRSPTSTTSRRSR